MDSTQSAQQVTTQTPEPQTSGKVESSTESWKYNPEYHRVSSFFGVDKYDREDEEVAKKMAFIIDWGKEKVGDDNYLKALIKADELRKELGVNYQGKPLINVLYQQIRLMQDKDELAKLDLFKRGKEVAREIAEERLKVKLKMENIKPVVDEKEIEQKISTGMKDINKQIKRKIKSQISQTVNKGIKEALQKATAYY